LKKYIEEQSDSSLDKIAESYFYKPMRLSHLKFYPLNYFEKSKIVPTEFDTEWRNELIHGRVHDQGAAMLGGVGGHAGLFGNATDVAKFMQLYLNEGSYGGKRFFNAETMNKFNTCYYCDEDVRRGEVLINHNWMKLVQLVDACLCQVLVILDLQALMLGQILRKKLFMFFYPIEFIPFRPILNL